MSQFEAWATRAMTLSLGRQLELAAVREQFVHDYPREAFSIEAVLSVLLEDMKLAIEQNSEYRERNTHHWAKFLANIAFSVRPDLKQ